jgi:flagellar hook-associated protein 1 FlgK
MYISTYTALQSALSGITAAQEQLDTTSNNIANADTPGYTDETVNTSASLPLTLAGDNGAGIQVGTGVNVSAITSARNQFLDASYRLQNSVSGNASTAKAYLDQVQSTLNEPSTTGISSQLATFWGAWSSLATDPTSLSAKQAVVSDGQTLAGSISQLSTDLTTVQQQAASQFNTITQSGGEVEADAGQIDSLNTAIQQAQAAGENPNQLEDQRGEVIDQLSSLANVSVTAGSDAADSDMVNVSLGGLTGSGGVQLVTAADTGSTMNTSWEQSLASSSPADIGGTLGALMSVAGSAITGGSPGQIDGYLNALDGTAQTLADAVNNPIVNGSQEATDPPFFSYSSSGAPGSLAASLTVNPALTGTPANAGLVQVTDTSTTGDADIALAIAGLSGGAGDQSYRQFVSAIGSDAQAADNNATTQSALATAVSNQRQSVVGVDLSQEETNVIQEQQAYQACAQIMNTFNTMISTLITQVG